MPNKTQLIESFSKFDENEQKEVLHDMVKIHADTVVEHVMHDVVSGITAGCPETNPTEQAQAKPVDASSVTRPKAATPRKYRKSSKGERDVPEIGKVSNMTEVAKAIVQKFDKIEIKKAIEFVQQHIDSMPISATNPKKIEMAVRNAFAAASKAGHIKHVSTGLYGPQKENKTNADQNAVSATEKTTA